MEIISLKEYLNTVSISKQAVYKQIRKGKLRIALLDNKKYVVLEEKEKQKANILDNIRNNPNIKTKPYVTGISALNIPYKGIQCDWHQVDMLKYNIFKVNGINFTGAVDIFKDYGIYDNTDFFLKHGYKVQDVLVATPIRALLDMLYNTIVAKNSQPFFELNDYMFEDISKTEISQKLNLLAENLEQEQKIFLEK